MAKTPVLYHSGRTKGLALLEVKIEINILEVRDGGKIKKQIIDQGVGHHAPRSGCGTCR